VQISASEAFAKRKISRFFIFFVSTSVTLRNYFHLDEKATSITPINYTLVSSGNHIQNIQITGGNPVCAHMGDFTMAVTRPGLNKHDDDKYGHMQLLHKNKMHTRYVTRHIQGVA